MGADICLSAAEMATDYELGLHVSPEDTASALRALHAEIVRLRGEVFRIAGGDTECCPNPTTENALDCLRDLRQCYDETPAPAMPNGVEVLPATGPFVDRIVRIFRTHPHDDTFAIVLLDYAHSAIRRVPLQTMPSYNNCKPGATTVNGVVFSLSPDDGLLVSPEGYRLAYGDVPSCWQVKPEDFPESRAADNRDAAGVCSCPSGDGSLRWPCKAHPPEAIAPADVGLTEQQRADRDLLLHGTSFMRDGKRIDPTTVQIELAAPAEAKGGAHDCMRSYSCPACARCYECNRKTGITPQPADGGAVAYRWWSGTGWEYGERTPFGNAKCQPLYTHPPAAHVQQEAVDREAWAEALELPDGYEVEEFLPGGWHYAWTRADGERMVSGTTWNHPALAAIAAWQYAPATHPAGDALVAVLPNPAGASISGVIANLRVTAKVLKEGVPVLPFNQGMAIAYTTAANELEAALQHRGDSRGGES